MSRQATGTQQITAKHIVLAQAIIDNWHLIGRKCKDVDTLLLDGVGFPNDNEIVLCITEIAFGGECIKYITVGLGWMYYTGENHGYVLTDKIAELIMQKESTTDANK